MFTKALILVCVLGFGLSLFLAGCQSTGAVKKKYESISSGLKSLAGDIKGKVESKELSINDALVYWERLTGLKKDLDSAKEETGSPWWIIVSSILGSLLGVKLTPGKVLGFLDRT